MMNVNVLRLAHRIGRDTRITTHVCLTSRAFGASKIYLSGEEDHKLMENVRDTADRWGGNFEIEYAKNYMGVINKWKDNGGKVGSSISTKTDYVVAGENMGPAKLEKANQLKIPIISEDDFIQLVNES